MQYAATTLNLSMILESHARLQPEKTVIVWNETRLTFKQLNDYANKIANGLREIGIEPGDKVALSCPNLPYFPAAYFGILKAGAVVVPLNVLFKPREVAYHLQDSNAKAVFCFEGTPELPLAEMVKAGFEMVETCQHFISMPLNPMSPSSSPVENGKTLIQLIGRASDKFQTYPTKPEDTAVILYTSGTTGQPKGAELTHFNMTMNAMISRELYLSKGSQSTNDDNAGLITLPLFHSTGQTCQMNAYIYHGFRCVLLPRFEPQAVLDAMEREKISFWTGVPTMYWALLKYVEENKIDVSLAAKHLKMCSSGGAPMPVEVIKAFENKFGVRILEGYGLSETAPVASFNQPERPSKPGTVGQPLFSVEIECQDEDGNPVPTGERGEVVIRGHNVMKGYYNKPEATAEAFKNGWFHTGDIGMFDDEGYLSIVDRKKDMILRGGYNIYPRELEEVIMTHPAVSLVAVIGVADERLGEEVKAFIVKKQNADLTVEVITAWCKEQFAANKYPRHIEFCESLPIGATGKILKRELRQL